MLYVCAKFKKWKHINLYTKESNVYYGVIDTDDGKIDFLQEEELKSIIKKYNLTVYSEIDALKCGYPVLIDYYLDSPYLDGKYHEHGYYGYDECGEYGEFRDNKSKDINDFLGVFQIRINHENYLVLVDKDGAKFHSEFPYDSCDNIAEQCFKFKLDSIREFRKKKH